MSLIHPAIETLIFNEEQILNRVSEIAEQINKDYEGKEEIIFITILKGAFMFMSDLVKKIKLPIKCEFVSISTYGDGHLSTENLKLLLDVQSNIEGKDVIIIEDVLDTGFTLSTFIQLLKQKNPNSIKIAVCFIKEGCQRVTNLNIDYFAFIAPPLWLIGYGLDNAQLYRNLPYVGSLKKEYQ
eukprot:TRINITY_DN267_c0_g1_i1.p1 TRINITY_DN267_c0_g1~~TRINITY_DN267_c0_g1_i1.p1  ORF type:complete len:196 (-),score=69.39 TRINITY_DN267_c0_g1_i1:104-652(-)